MRNWFIQGLSFYHALVTNRHKILVTKYLLLTLKHCEVVSYLTIVVVLVVLSYSVSECIKTVAC